MIMNEEQKTKLMEHIAETQTSIFGTEINLEDHSES